MIHEIEKVDMDKLSLHEQLSTLLRGDMINRYHANHILNQENFIFIQCALLRLSSTWFGMICAATHKEKDVLELLSQQSKLAICEIIGMINSISIDGIFDMPGNKKNAH